MTYILAIDTTLGACSAAIIKDGSLLENKQEVRARGHVERLLPMIDEVCVASDVEISEIDLLGVTIGPGTFAGVRIGLSAAKGLGLALDIAIIPITTLEALAFQFARNNEDFSGNIAVAIDARRGEVYLQSFELSKGNIKPISDAEAVPIALVKENLADDIKTLIGSAGDILEDINLSCEAGYDYPDASYIAQMAVDLMGRAKRSDDISPLYLRAPDAKLPAPLNMIVSDD